MALRIGAIALVLAPIGCGDQAARVAAPAELSPAAKDLSGIPGSATVNLTLKSFEPSAYIDIDVNGVPHYVGPYVATGLGSIGDFLVYCINRANGIAQTDNWDVRALTFEEAADAANIVAVQRTLGLVSAIDMVKKLRQAAYLADQYGLAKTPNDLRWDEIQYGMWKLFPSGVPVPSSSLSDEAVLVAASLYFANSTASTSTWRVVVDVRAWNPNVQANQLKQTFITKNSPATLGDFVWHDVNANGIQESGEPGIASATVTATGPNGPLAPTTTNGSGFYQFSNLVAGSYTVCVATPASYAAASPDGQGNSAIDSDGSGLGNCYRVSLAPGETNLKVDFGFYNTAAIGDRVWYDANGNGVQDVGEVGIEGVTVTATGPGGTLTTTTGANGIYSFANLVPGTYSVCVAVPTGYNGVSPLSGVGGTNATDSNGSGTPNCGTVTVASGATDLTIDFGFTRLKASLGDFVWHDLNANGVQDLNEPGIGGVTLTLSGPGVPAGTTTLTNASGAYSFTNLEPGMYTVCVTKPAVYSDASPTGAGTPGNNSDGSITTGCAAPVTLVAGQNSTETDFGFYKLAAIGDFVWYDANSNGIQDSGEPGISGATVTLNGPGGLQATTTNTNGAYSFTNLLPGTYTVCVAVPTGYSAATSAAQGGNSATDSNGSGTPNCSTVTVASGTTNNTIDFGFTNTGVTPCVARAFLSSPTASQGGSLTDYLFVFTDGSVDANWQGASKGFAGNVVVDGIQAKERTSGGVPYAGTIYTNDATLGAWKGIVDQNSGQANAVYGQVALVSTMETQLNAAFTKINNLTVSPGYASVSSTSLNGLNTQNGIAQTIVINVTSGFQVSSQIRITGDPGDLYILRWDSDASGANGYQGEVKFQSGGAIIPLGGLTAANFIHVAGKIGSSGGGSTPSELPQGPRLDNGTGALVAGAKNFSGGGFFTGYWLTTGDDKRETSSLSNAIFVGGWYSTTTKFSMTSGTSGVYVGCPQ